MTFLIVLIPAALIIAATFVVAFFASLFSRLGKQAQRRSPLTRNLLRAPGFSLSKRIETLDQELLFLFMISTAVPLVFYAMHVSQSYFGGVPESVLRTAVSILTCLGILIFATFRMVLLARQRKIAILGLEGERATGEELNQLMLEGCRVFHDIPFPYGNIDHVVVSQSGVFTVNSKMLGKTRNDKADTAIVVDQRLGIVYFPDRKYQIPMKQFDTERDWLSGYLTSAVGQPVNAESILALPGWFVKERIGRGSVCVINPYKPRKFFIHNRLLLEPTLVRQISHQLEQLCRDIEPSFLEKQARWENLQ